MPAETRYYRSDSQTVNGLTARALGTSLSGTGAYSRYSEGSTEIFSYGRVGIRVWKRASDGTETEITGGSAVAQVSVASGDPLAEYSATWDCPATALDPTDSIVIRVYGCFYDRIPCDPTNLLDTWTSEQLGASSLDAATWTVHYWVYVHAAPAAVGYTNYIDFYYDGDYDSRIENFSYTVAVPTVTIRPNAAGVDTLLKQYPDTGSNYDKVDEETADEDDTYVYYDGTIGTRDLYNLEDISLPAGTIITKVTVYVRARKTGGGAGDALQIRLYTHENHYYSDYMDVTTSYANYSHEWTTNPYTGATWTEQEINGLQAGVWLAATETGYESRCTQVWVVVEYTTVARYVSRIPATLPETKPSEKPTKLPAYSV